MFKMSTFQNGTNPLTVFPLELWEAILDRFTDSKNIRSFYTAFPEFDTNYDLLLSSADKSLTRATPQILKPKLWSGVIDRFMERKGYRNKSDIIRVSTGIEIHALHHGPLRNIPLIGKRLAIEPQVGEEIGSYLNDLLKFLEEFGESVTSAEMRFTVELDNIKAVKDYLKSIVNCLNAMKNLRVLIFQFKLLDEVSGKQSPTADVNAAYSGFEFCTDYPSLPNLEHLTVLESGNLSSTVVGYFAKSKLPVKRLTINTSLPEADYNLIESSFSNLLELETTLEWKTELSPTPFFSQLRSLTKLTITQFTCGSVLEYYLFAKISSLNIKYLSISYSSDDLEMFVRPLATIPKIPSVEYLSIRGGIEYGFDFFPYLVNLKHFVLNTPAAPDAFSNFEISRLGRQSLILAENIMYDLRIPVSSIDSIWTKCPGLISVEFDYYKHNILQVFCKNAKEPLCLAY